LDSTNEEIFIQRANIYSKKDNHEAAVALLNKALNLSENSFDIYSLLGMEYLFMDDFKLAKESFMRCVDFDEQDYSSLYNVIYCFEFLEDYDGAIHYLNDYLERNPYCEVAWHQLGRQYFILKDYMNALRAFDYAVLIDEQFLGGYIEKAKTLEKLERYEEAIDNFKETLKLDDPTAYVYMKIGYCFDKIGNSIEAVQNYKKAVYEDPLLDKAWIAITSILIRDRNFTKALYYVNKALEIDDSNYKYWRSYAQINLNLGYYEEAINGFKNCISLQDYELVIWIGLADAQNLEGDYEEAIKTLKKARALFEDTAEIEYRLGGLNLRLQNLEKGAAHLSLALTLDYEYHNIIAGIFAEEFKIDFVQDMIERFGETS